MREGVVRYIGEAESPRVCGYPTIGYQVKKKSSHEVFLLAKTPAIVDIRVRGTANQLNLWSWREESNPRPADYKSAALPTELRQRRMTQAAYSIELPLLPQFTCRPAALCRPLAPQRKAGYGQLRRYHRPGQARTPRAFCSAVPAQPLCRSSADLSSACLPVTSP